MFRTLLVANRGEIACRVIRAAQALGIQAVAVHSPEDRDAPHVHLADRAVALDETMGYLDQDAILAAAASTGSEAIHPGYGFLSENAAFARRCQDAGLVWVGPPPEAMELLGDKVAARGLARKEGVPIAAGSEAALGSAAEAASLAEEVGYPVMLKAAAGGGGIGMRVVHEAAELEGSFKAAAAQAQAAFGDGRLFLERFFDAPHHVEVQIIADQHGHVVHLGERECSVQRRHQKLIEEAPAPCLSDEERARLHEAAVALVRAAGYTNAGTVEFLYQDGQLSFMEVNARLQVEHPVTEMVTGIDLVRTQLLVAAGEALPFTQADVRLEGHAIECRINAEDPYHDFRPSPGTLVDLTLPQGEGVRVDHGLRAGWTVPGTYDSLVAKLNVHATSRDAAIARMDQALASLHVRGFPTTAPFHREVIHHDAFRHADVTTGWLEQAGIADAFAAAGRLRAARIAAGLAMAPNLGIGAWAAQQATPSMRAMPIRSAAFTNQRTHERRTTSERSERTTNDARGGA